MQNELCRMGMLVFDLKRRKELVPDETGFSFLEEEFRRIIVALGYEWHQKVEGWPYLLEFHRLETLRLYEAVVKLESFQMELSELGRQNDFLRELHTELMMHFSQLLTRIDKMIASTDLASKPYNLN